MRIDDDVRKAFETGSFEEALDQLEDLTGSNPPLASRLYLLRPNLYRFLEEWSREVLMSRELFLPPSIYDSDAPRCLKQVRAFEGAHSASLTHELSSHPEHFRRVELDEGLIERAIAEWREEHRVRSELLFSDPDALLQVEEECLQLVRMALRRAGKHLKDFDRGEMIAKAKRGLWNAPNLVAEVNRRLASAREAFDLDDLR